MRSSLMQFENRTSHSHGILVPNSFIELEDGTKACKGTKFVFEPYAGNEDSLVRFQGRTDKGKLVFKGESPLTVEVKDAYRGADWPDCELVYLSEAEAKICLNCYPKENNFEYCTRIKTDQEITKPFCCPFFRYCECKYNKQIKTC